MVVARESPDALQVPWPLHDSPLYVLRTMPLLVSPGHAASQLAP